MKLSAYIDHTVLKPDASRAEVTKICEETLEHGFASACLNPFWVGPMKELFPSLRICTVINFPHGMGVVGMHEAERAVLAGALELDIVINSALVRERSWDQIREELSSYRRIYPELTLKLIIESCNRSDLEIVQLTEICSEVGFDFIKTSTGFAREGASLHAVRLMAKHLSHGLGIKASGGIKTRQDAEEFIRAGATRIGTSSGISIIV